MPSINFVPGTVIPSTWLNDVNAGIFTDLPTAVSNATAALAVANAAVPATGDTTISGVKTFSSSPLVPTASPLDNSTKAASTAYVDAAVAAGSSGTGEDTTNDRLNWIYQSKFFAGYRRGVNLFADGYKAADGINAGASSNYTLDTVTGSVGPSASGGTMISRTAGVAIGNMTTSGGIAAAFDGITVQVSANCAVKSPATSLSAYVGKNFTGVASTVGSVLIYPSSDVNYFDAGTATAITINLRAKHTAPANAADGTLLGTTGSFADTASTKTINSNDTTTVWEYMWIELLPNNTGANMFIAEVQFYLPTTINNATIISTAQTVSSSTKSKATIEYDNTSTPVLNTDITVELSCDGGTTWQLGTLSAKGFGQSGRLVAETNEVTCVAGTSAVSRIKTFNGKLIAIYGNSYSIKT